MKDEIFIKDAVKSNFFFAIILNICLINSCSTDKIKNENMTQELQEKEEKYRPGLHFTPQKNWMNDPNGLFYLDEEFHLYFQHNPKSNVWGPMHWGHATSKDLINWEEHSIALFPDELGTIFSGSVVVDHKNSSGLGTIDIPPVIAIYTNHNENEQKRGSNLFQTQSIAYSLDKGFTWIKYERNPVISNPGIKNFRDPKVFWMSQEKKWIMTLAAGQETHFYSSSNLIDWKFLSVFGKGIGNHDGVWECPDLFPAIIKESGKTKWVLIVSINPGGPNGGSATQYFVGDFDGKKFIVDSDFKLDLKNNHNFWIDFGKDNYAGVTFSNWKNNDGNPLFLGWMSNWQYANKVPTFKWRSTMTIPRILELFQTETSYILNSKPSIDWESFTNKKIKIQETKIGKSKTLVNNNSINLSSSKVFVEIKNLEINKYTFILSNQEGDSLLFGYNHRNKSFFIDRSKSGEVDFSDDFSKKPSIASRLKSNNSLMIDFIIDKTSIELFFDSGEIVMSEIFFPNKPFEVLNLVAESSSNSFFSAEILELDPVKNKIIN